MGAFKKFLWSLMTIALIILSAILASVALVDDKLRYDMLSYLDLQNYRYILLGVAIVVLFFAIILLIDIIANQNDKREYLVEDNDGDIFITKNSLDSTVNSAVRQFEGAELTDSKVKIIKGETVEANIKCNIFGNRDFEDLGRKIQAEVERGLKELTGLQSSNAHVQLNKAEKSKEREIR
ncbi:alkaline shock response membrane anchor protein AmaP [Anaerococcus sp. AGMB00486]|uniref:Alkaline shock response membrane anchor protein AmaP n=2 Tax=Anaerococcus TaxID=165779 RepID=A0ABX2NBL0_9FIRM|nr:MULTISPECIES: alkaline shock response membrane anchor protein AmaP [Anaerococcus]MDY3005609.1 alkaline shock response membrane anchor protein AmaP [Anaerococcus porci]MSS78153.1 alkaline shock response membrane anchor protein AmaP [Anaerococcus porci]NVF12043.1 alkaline shock response membrane anchor protein AmaP [Anaerococcus faecalis]